MQMMNRAIEDVADFREMMQKLTAERELQIGELDPLEPSMSVKKGARDLSPKRPGENREQYRARIHGKVSA